MHDHRCRLPTGDEADVSAGSFDNVAVEQADSTEQHGGSDLLQALDPGPDKR